ncbi:MAG: OmpA family protein [Gemmatimonadota bacterium]
MPDARGRMRGARPLALAIALGLAAVLGDAARLPAQDIEGEIGAVAERLEAARAARLHLIAPRHLDRATERLVDARARYERGGRIEDIRRRLNEANRELAEAEQLEEIGGVLLRGALEARSDALEANAPEFAAKLWDEGEKMIRDAGRRVENGDQNGARERGSRAERRYREAEFASIQADVLGRARDLRQAGMRVKADRRAPATFALADSLFREAELVLQGDRYQRSDARQYAESAAEEYRHAGWIASLVDSVEARRLSVEELILRHEAEVARIAEALNFEPRFVRGSMPVTEHALAAVQSVYEDRDNLRSELAARETEISGLASQLDSLDARLAELEQREATVAAELRERERRERKLREVRAIFSRDEAEVLLGGGLLIVRLYGLSFASGSAEISPDNFSLLTKLQRVLREFPNSLITIQGHTDSQGNDDYNQALSERRAIAVREYLLANMALSSDRVEAVGFGESRPIATNDTEEGRAKNRRIEVSVSVVGA